MLTKCLTCGKEFKAKLRAKGQSPKFCCLACRHDPIASFWRRVNKTESCWLWLGSCDTNGYGQFKIRGRSRIAHRVSWEFTRGPIPKGLCVLHNCPGGDNKVCVNPDHLWLGTNWENVQDAIRKLQFPIGNACASAKLCPESVRAIRADFATGAWRMGQLATRYGVGRIAILNVVHRVTWKHVL